MMRLWFATAMAETPADDEGWLEAAVPEPAVQEAPAEDEEVGSLESFGHALDVFGVEVSWSGYGDLVFEWSPEERVRTFEASHFNPLLGARLAEPLWAEVEIEFEDSGTEVKVEYGILDFAPVDAFGLRLGQFLVPIGQFNEQLHPSFRWPQVDRPAMFSDVVPAVWSETGVQARGTLRTDAVALRYAAYLSNGLGSDFDPDAPDPIRAMRDNASDQNYDFGTGGELELDLIPGRIGETTVAASGYTGAIDADGSLQFTLADLALSSRFGPVTLRGEAAANFLGDQAFGQGLYVQAVVQVGRLTPSVRYDRVHERLADPVSTSAVTATAMVRLYPFWNVRAEGALGLEDRTAELSAMSAFFF